MRKTLCWFSLALIATLHGYAAPAAQAVRNPKYNLLAARLDSVTLTVTLTPFAPPSADSGGGLRSALIYVSRTMRVEPHLRRLDGSYVNGAARISNEAMLRVLDVLDRGGFLATAETYYSERSAKPQGPPPAAKHIGSYLDLGQKSQTAEFRLTCFDDNYYTEYIILPSWDKQLVPLLTELQGAIADPPAKALITQLLTTAALKAAAKQ